MIFFVFLKRFCWFMFSVVAGSVKRLSHESWISGAGGGGGGEEHNHSHRQPSNSPASRSGDANSPSSSNVSVRKKMVSSNFVQKKII